MKKVLFVLTAALLITVFAAAQAQDAPYQVNFYANRNNTAGADQFLRIINTGVVGNPLSADEGRICANIYAFDDTQEMLECCSCPITANGLLTLSLVNNLMQNPLTGLPAPATGVIKIVGTNQRPACDPTAINIPVDGLVAWQGQVEQPTTGAFVTAITQYAPATLTPQESTFLGQACSFVQYLGSGKGVCTCGTGSH